MLLGKCENANNNSDDRKCSMLVALDIGNTHTVTGIFDTKGKLLLTFRIATNDKMTEDEYFSYFRNITKYNDIEIKRSSDVILSSVVPNVISVYNFFSRKYFGVDPFIVDLNSDLNFTFHPRMNPTGFGSDRILGIEEALKTYPDKNILIFDFGTATTYDMLIKNEYVGGGILPGIEMSMNALFRNTAKLPRVKFSTPSSILGNDTITQIQAANFYGFAGQIKYIIQKVKQEVGDDIFILATGGLGKILSSEISEIDQYDPDLCIRGLYTIYKNNKK